MPKNKSKHELAIIECIRIYDKKYAGGAAEEMYRILKEALKENK